MVNCKKCGSPLSLNNAFCPSCGEPNPEAQEHLKKLRELDNKFENVNLEVASAVKKTKKGYGILVILIMLLLANLIFFVMHQMTYEIADRIIANKMSESEIKSHLDQLLEEREYIELSLFMDKFSLSYRDYEDYMNIAYLARYYNKIVETTTQYLYGSTDAFGDPLSRACRAILDYENDFKRLQRRDNSEMVRVHTENINTEVNGFLRNYLHLTDDDISDISDLNESSLLILMNERLNHEK